MISLICRPVTQYLSRPYRPETQSLTVWTALLLNISVLSSMVLSVSGLFWKGSGAAKDMILFQIIFQADRPITQCFALHAVFKFNHKSAIFWYGTAAMIPHCSYLAQKPFSQGQKKLRAYTRSKFTVKNMCRPGTQSNRPRTQNNRLWTQLFRPQTQSFRPFTQKNRPITQPWSLKNSINKGFPGVLYNTIQYKYNKISYNTTTIPQ